MQKKIIQRMAVVACLLCLVMGYIATPLSGQDIPKAQAATMLARTNVTMKQRTATTVTLSIRKVSGAQGYQVYRATLGSGKYEQIANTATTTYKDAERKSSVGYCYKVRPYKTVNGKKVYGSYSNVACVSSTLKKTENVKVTTQTNGNKVSWNRVSGASKYNVYRSDSKDGEYKYIGCSSAVSYTDKTAGQSKVYYYRVRAYRGCFLVKYYGVYSDKVASTIKEADANDDKKEDSNKDQNQNQNENQNQDSNQNQNQNENQNSNQDQNNNQNGNQNSNDNQNNNSNQNQDNNQNENQNQDNSSTATSSNAAYTKEVLRLVNIERAKEGLSELTTTSILEKAAYTRALETKQSFSHTRPNGSSFSSILKEMGISYQAAGENIAYGQRTPADVVNAWMNSSGHRANIMSKNYNKLGVGCYIDSNNVVYWTQLFTN